MSTEAVAVLRTPAAALALLDPERCRLAEALSAQHDSAAGLARRLGETRQRINYHLRVLEEAGLIEMAEARQRRGRVERVMRPSAQRFVIDPATVGTLAGADPDAIGDRFSAAYLVALAARAITELAALLARAATRRQRLATASYNTRVRLASPAHYRAFVDELNEAIADVVARHHEGRGEGRWFRVIGAAYPGPTPTNVTENSTSA
ncbi:MAG TPA: winged helix-turn-helix domain-containing protein [Gemmatimonadaceae bacterium]|nr:winged helix-turn-helix domain-containing protein [Gemmatimonadaceae bacterium]